MKLNESAIEQLVIHCLQTLGYQHIYAPDSNERAQHSEVLLEQRLRQAVQRINPAIPTEAQEDAIKQIKNINSPQLLTNNETFHTLLTTGVKVSYQKNGEAKGDLVFLIDFDHPERNDFVVANQVTILENGHQKRPDLILYINGLPLVVIELKNAADENTTIKTAFQQLSTYQATIPSLFTYNAFNVISDGLEAKAGTISADLSRYMAWKTEDGKAEASHLIGQIEILTKGMLRPNVLLDLVRHFIVFEKTKREDKQTNIISIVPIKKIAAYHQYYAVNRAIESTIRAAGYRPTTAPHIVEEEAAQYGLASVHQQPIGDRKGGVVWHTQGSGKSLSMVFYTGKIVLALDNPTVVITTDRNDLDDQLFDTFAASAQLLRQDPQQANDRDTLKKLLKVASGGIIFTTIQKFQPEEGNIYEQLTDRANVIVIADEAHRTQYGFKAKTIDDKDQEGNVIGKKTVYGFAKYMRDALPNATYLGFTGTPIEKTDVNTPAVFGNYIDIYDIAQAVEDGATVRIYYESRLAKVNLSDDGKQLVKELDEELSQDELTTTQKAKVKWTQLEALVGSQQRIANIAKDIIWHFEQRQQTFAGKALIVTMSRRIAADLYDAIVQLNPAWHSDDPQQGAIKVVMTSASSDGAHIARHHTTKTQRKALADRMKDTDDPLQLVIVCDMWLTGFDVPCLHTLYLDKPMKGHNLMQAIARVNRVYKDKPGGLIVDYLGIAADLRQALAFYADAGGKGDPTLLQEQAVQLMHEKLEIVQQLFFGFNYQDYYQANTSQKLSLILAAEEHILGLEDGKKRYIDQVAALSKAFALAIPHDQAMNAKDEIAFFQAIKARLAKFDHTGEGKTDEEIETTIRQVIDKALVSEQVVDIFDAAGIKKPDISILSEDFLLEIKNMQRKNIAMEVLKKLLNDEIRARAKTNLVQSKTLMEMLENAIRRYHNNVISAAEVIDELIKLGKEITQRDTEAAHLGLTPYEYAFYTAVAANDSAKELMQKDKLRELAVALTNKVRDNASIDWTMKESVRSKLKVIIKRTLRQFGYPPDMAELATETVLKQAALIADELVQADLAKTP